MRAGGYVAPRVPQSIGVGLLGGGGGGHALGGNVETASASASDSALEDADYM